MKFKLLIVTALLISVLCLMLGCSQKIECNSPYTVIENTCCLDKNSNLVCDDNENYVANKSENKITTLSENTSLKKEPIIQTPFCGDDRCQLNETCASCADDCACSSGKICRYDTKICEDQRKPKTFELYVGDSVGRKVSNFGNIGPGDVLSNNFFIRNNETSTKHCEYNITKGGAIISQTNLRIGSNMLIPISNRIVPPRFRNGTIVVAFIVNCENDIGEITYTLKYSSI
jgi:hypothetical protein